MTEREARDWIIGRFGEQASERVATLLAIVAAENQRQNLIAPSTLEIMWSRHALDSAQLVLLGRTDAVWLDVGTGGGFPGLVVALLRPGPMLLVEPRRKRAEFLIHCASALKLQNVQVFAAKVEGVSLSADIISARAVASTEKILQAAIHCARENARWLLPRGLLLETEVEELRQRWRGMFHVEQSLSESASSILVIDGVARR